MSTTAMLTVEPAAGALGAFVTGVDLTHPARLLRSCSPWSRPLADHLVVFLPDQPMTLDDLERLTDQLGGRESRRSSSPLDGRPHVIRVIKEPGDELNFANAWHTDLSYLPVPPSYTLLHAWDVPVRGGDTVWANQYLALDALSDGLRKTLRGLDAVHSAGTTYGTGGYLDQVKGKSSMAIAPSTMRSASSPPGGEAPPGDGPAEPLCQLRVHHPDRGLDEQREHRGCSHTSTG